MDSAQSQNIISFCTGYAGIELGLRRISPNFRTVAYVEIEAFAVANLVSKIEEGLLDAAPVWTDIKTFDGGPFRGKVDGIIGGYPCQPFSNAGKRQGAEDPRHLWPYIEKHIRTIRPVWCFFENVSGHLTLGFEEVFRSLRDMGYSVEAGLFTAAEVGAPHKRERLFILAHDTSVGRTTWRPEPAGQCGQASIASGGELDNPMLRRHRGENKEICTGRDGSVDAGELADAERTEPRAGEQRIESKTSDRRRDRPTDGSTELAQPDRDGRSGILRQAGHGTDRTEQRTNPDGQGVGDGKQRAPCRLADGDGSGCQKQCGPEPIRQEHETAQCSGSRWPAAPGTIQKEWEYPRTVKSGMGRAVDGFASRVDELRLLGNGVVPATAELAFKTLWEKILS